MGGTAGETKPRVRYQTPLRAAQRDLTRSRIKNAARGLFYDRHYDATTMDDIATSAGLRRSTLYLHYRDKAEILAEVIADFAPKAHRAMAGMPGPAPTLPQLERWIGNVAQFVASERAPLSTLLEARRRMTNAAPFEALTAQLLEGLGENSQRFREAAREEADPTLRARALLLLRQLIYACDLSLTDTDAARASALLRVTAEDFHRFLLAQD